MSYGVEARDPTQPEWLNVERFCKFVMGGGSIRYAIQLVLGAVRKLAEGKVSLEETHLPMDPRAWLEVLYERERETAPEGLRMSTGECIRTTGVRPYSLIGTQRWHSSCASWV